MKPFSAKPFMALLKVNFKSLLINTAGFGRKKRKSVSGLAALLFLSILMVFLSGTYSFLLATLLAPTGGLDIMLMLITLFSLFFPMVFTLYSGQSLIFSAKDVDLVFSLPVSAFSILLSRLLALYLEVLLMVELMLLPAGIAWLAYGGGGGAFFLIFLLIEGAFLAFLPTLISLVFGYFVGAIVSRTRFKNLFSVLFSLLLIAAIMVLSFSFSAGVETISAQTDSIRASLTSSFPLLGWVAGAATQPNFLYFLFVILFCTVPFLAVAWIFSRFYKSILTRLTSHASRRDFQLQQVSASGSFSALLKNEARRYLNTPAYMLNTGIGIILAVAAAVLAAFQKNAVQSFLSTITLALGEDFVSQYLPVVLLGILAFCLMMISPACVSISLEGKNLWILKEAPLDPSKIFAAKAGFQFLLCAFTVVVVTPFIAYAFLLPFADMLAIFLLALLYSAFAAMLGVVINLKLPRLDADNETIVIKQSASVLVNMLVDFLVIALLAVLFWLLGNFGANFHIFSAVVAILFFILNVLLGLFLSRAGQRLFTAL